MKVVKKRNMQLPLEIQIMIIEMLEFLDALVLCSALNIPEELAYQYHIYNRENYYRDCDIFYNEIWKDEIPIHAKAILRNAGFQSRAAANEKVRLAILSKDLELVKYALQDPAVDYNVTYFNPLTLACTFGEGGIIEYILSNADINSTVYFSAFEVGRCAAIRILLSDSRFDFSGQNNFAIIDGVIRRALFNLYDEFSRNFCKRLVFEQNIQTLRLLISDPRVYPSANVTRAILKEIPLLEIGIIKRLLFDQRLNLPVLDLCFIFIYRLFYGYLLIGSLTIGLLLFGTSYRDQS